MKSQPSVQNVQENDTQSPSSPLQSLQAQPWLRQYQAVIRETDEKLLWRRIESTEPILLTRLDAVRDDQDYASEREVLNEALAVLDLLKRNRLGFHKADGAPAL